LSTAAINFDLLLKLRLVVARFGEMDIAKWWNTRGQLGSLGAAALRRGFPRTHRFAQARSVFAVAAHRCSEVFDPPHSITLWRLPESIEEDFEAHWEHWLDHAADWEAFFESLERIERDDLVAALGARDLVGDGDVAGFTRLKRSAEGRAVLLPGTFTGADQDIRLLALGFGRSEGASLAIPYMRSDDR
jgi:hypothetical protein